MAPAIGAALLALGACGHDKEVAEPVAVTPPRDPGPAAVVTAPPPAPEAEAASASEPVATPDAAAPRPIWWFDGDHRHERMLKVCMEAIADDVSQAKELLGEALIARIRAEFGDAPVDLGITQDIAILPDGRVRLAALFEIQPRADAPHAEGSDGDE